MKALWEAYYDKAMILVVYIREAHPAKADQTAEDAGWKVIDGTVFRQPKTYEERRKLAETACTFWDLPIPTLGDTMEPSIGATYRAWPNRSYLIDTEGKIVYRGVKGPPGVNVHECELELRKLLGITEGSPVTKPPPKRRAPTGRGRLSGRRRRPAEGSQQAAAPDRPPKTPWWLADKSKDQAKKAGTQDAQKQEAEQPDSEGESPETETPKGDPSDKGTPEGESPDAGSPEKRGAGEEPQPTEDAPQKPAEKEDPEKVPPKAEAIPKEKGPEPGAPEEA